MSDTTDILRAVIIRMGIRASIALPCLLANSLVTAQEKSPDLTGKTVQLVNNFPAGGSADIWARIQARHIGRFLSGKPSIVVHNRGGASGLVGYSWLANVAPADGLTIGVLGGTLAAQQALGKFPSQTPDVLSLQIIAGAQDTGVFFARGEVFPTYPRSLLSPTRKPMILASLSGDDSGQIRDRLFMTLLGHAEERDFRQVIGFRGGNDVYLAMNRGEVDFYGTRVAGYLGGPPSREVSIGNWTAIWQGGVPIEEGRLIRDASIEDIP